MYLGSIPGHVLIVEDGPCAARNARIIMSCLGMRALVFLI